MKQPLRHQRVALVAHLHPAERVTLRGVEPGGYDHQVRVERLRDWVDDEVKRREVIGVG